MKIEDGKGYELLSMRALNALEQHRAETFETISYDDLYYTRGVGRATMKEFKQFFKDNGFILKPGDGYMRFRREEARRNGLLPQLNRIETKIDRILALWCSQ